MQAYCGEGKGEGACCQNTILCTLNKFIRITVTGIKVTLGIDDPDHWLGKRFITKPHTFDEGFPEKQGKFIIAIAGQTSLHTSYIIFKAHRKNYPSYTL